MIRNRSERPPTNGRISGEPRDLASTEKKMANKFVNYLKDVKLEMSKVSWSTRDELIGSTIVVLVSLGILSLFIGICDIILSRIVNIVMLMSR
jgi:preprotein translocase subunit SecE